MQTTKQK